MTENSPNKMLASSSADAARNAADLPFAENASIGASSRVESNTQRSDAQHETGKMTFRFATIRDIPLILKLIRELAEYEELLHEVVATEELLEEWIFRKNKAEVIFVAEDDKEVGFALFFHNFSTFLGKAGIYLEDLYVSPEYRGKGYGKALLAKLAQIALERGCGRLEWWCLDRNRPSVDFYLSLGAQPMDEWTVYRFSGKTLTRMAGEK